MNATQIRALGKVQKCLNLAADTRGDPTTRETAWRQAQALIAKHGLQLDKLEASLAPTPPAAPAMPAAFSSDWAPYWAQRTVAEAMAAGLKSPVLTREGWYAPGR